ncbi:Plasma membrane t-SNARE, secretory vesicle fusion [Actinomortierella ambigua]|uniref:Plasma membrane t-SNARE, secretory vesicle fusion n=1 Tax=Actinomortierella ambigua TaxID=1343610 RepID=A0A9P6U415_9FUNG|nr:Plasma membrane t-SNARE, secretory vesicle fusion [Actinomortierella ambigua]
MNRDRLNDLNNSQGDSSRLLDRGQVELTPLAGGSLNQFFQETDVISGKIQQFNSLIQEVDAQFLKNLNVDASPNSPGQKQLEELTQRTNALSNEIYDRLKALSESNKKVNTRADFEARKGRTTTLCTQFKNAVQRFQSIQFSNRQKTKEKTRRIYQIANPNATTEEVERAVDEQHIGQIFSQQLLQSGRMQQAGTTLNALQTRQQEIKQLEENALELARLYQQMEVLIMEQDVQFHQIEQQVDNAAKDLEKGDHLTGEAVKFAYLARKKKWILIGVVLLIIAIILIYGATQGWFKGSGSTAP